LVNGQLTMADLQRFCFLFAMQRNVSKANAFLAEEESASGVWWC